MKRRHPIPDDFEALIRIFPPEEGGRTSPTYNGIRWDLAYAGDDAKHLFMIWPDFFDDKGDSLPEDRPLPINVQIPARMTIVVEEMRDRVHRAKIHEGTRFYCHEGSRRMAEGRVTRITGLHQPR